MIEDLIYWTGVVALISFGLLLTNWRKDMSKNLCSECGCDGAHYCTGKPLPKDFDTTSFFIKKEDEKPLCGLELTVEEKIWQAMNNKAI